ncbi:MAG: DegV family protein [Acholeplasmatales bacterium]|jgi:DegV family protein with EDD domain|nr:DegV family protein [Acholeplasmatales bacterium]
MRKVQIIADSTSDIKNVKRIIDDSNVNYFSLYTKRNVKTLPLGVDIAGIYYADGVDLSVPSMFDKIESSKTMPKTSAISPQKFIDCFKEFIDKDMDIVYISLSSKISSTYNSAVIALESFDKDRIFVIDSESLSAGIGLSVMKACDLRDNGLSAEEICNYINKYKKGVTAQFGINSLEFLYKGGRASGLTFFISKIVRIKPLLVMKDGSLVIKDKIMGKTKKVIEKQFEYFLEDYKNGKVDTSYIFVTHCYAYDLKDCVKEMFVNANIPLDNVYESLSGCVISSHCGKGTLGILYGLLTK